MKKIEAYIQHEYLPRVVNSLEQMPGFPGLSILEILGHGRGPEIEGSYIQTEQNLTVHRRTLVLVVAEDSLVAEVVSRIRASSHTGNSGDGIIVISPVDGVIRIRTGETFLQSESDKK